MGKKRKHLSHEEIWDDSALLDSWDAALQEYQLYHSIHARGERVEDVIRQAENSGETSIDGAADMGGLSSEKVNGISHPEELEDGEVEEGQIDDDLLPDVGAKDETAIPEEEIRVNQDQHGSPPPIISDGTLNAPQPSTVPTLLVNGVQDEGLKNIMMSWYYAGYYTGLYEGLKQSDTAARQPAGNGKSNP